MYKKYPSGKTCSHATCKGICRRTKKPKKIYNLKRTAIRKRKIKKPMGNKIKLRETDWLFYLSIWNKRPHFCFETGDYLGHEPFTLFFHHVLAKGIRKYKKFRHCAWNIVLLNWSEHTNADNAMLFTPRVKQYHSYLIKHLDQINAGTYSPSFKKFKLEQANYNNHLQRQS